MIVGCLKFCIYIITYFQFEFDRNPDSIAQLCVKPPNEDETCQSWSYNYTLATSPKQSKLIQNVNANYVLDIEGEWSFKVCHLIVAFYARKIGFP